MIRSRALRFTTRSRTTGKAAARHGSISITSPVSNSEIFAVLRLVLDPEVAAARLLPVQRIAAGEHGQPEEVVDPARLLQRLVQRVGRTQHPQVAVEVGPQGGDLGDGLLQALL